ncbi:MAG: CoA-binding protein [archaeon]|jgi:hypothetical protein
MGKTILVVGASNNPEKNGYKIVKNLKEKGHNVVPINPKEKELLGIKVYSSISEFVKENPKVEINWVDLVVPPEIAQKVIEEVKSLGLTNVWFQPGSESDSAIKFCRDNKINCTHHACMMVDFLE